MSGMRPPPQKLGGNVLKITVRTGHHTYNFVEAKPKTKPKPKPKSKAKTPKKSRGNNTRRKSSTRRRSRKK